MAMSPRFLVVALALMPAGAPAANWSLSLSGGVATVGEEGGQPFVSATLYHYFGRGYLRGGVALFDGDGEAAVADPRPAQTRQLTIGGGYQAGQVLFDAYATIGERAFDPVVVDRASGRRFRL
jgi:hypothetical protein